MPRTETEQLVVSLEARVRDFEKNFAKANRTAGTNFRAIEDRAQQNSTRLQRMFASTSANVNGSFAAMGKGMLGAFGVGLGVSGIAMLARNALDAADAIGKAADRSGVGVEAFQRLKFAADLAGVSSQQLEQSLGMLNRRMAEGKVSGKDTEDALLRIAEQVANASSETERAAIVNEAFGRSGAQLLPLLKNGAAGIKQLTDEAERLGLVLDETTVRNAEALNDEMSRMMAVARTNVQAGLLSGLVRDTDGLRAAYSDPAFQQGLRAFGSFIGESLGFLVRNADTIMRVTRALAAVYVGAKVGAAIGGGRGAVIGGAMGAGVAGLVELMRDSADDVEASLGKIDKALAGFGSGDFAPAVDLAKDTGVNKLAEATADARFELDLLSKDWDEHGKNIARTIRGFGLIDNLSDVVPSEDVEAYIRSMRDLKAAQDAIAQGEADKAKGAQIWESTRTEAERYGETLKELNRLLAEGHLSEETYRRAVVKAQDDMKGAVEETNEAVAQFGDITASAFEDAILGGERLRDVVAGLAQDMARLLLRQHVMQPLGNAFSGFVGSLFSAKGNAFARGSVVPMAKGGMGSGGILRGPTAFPMRSGGMAIGGELADEAIMPLRRMPNGNMGIQALGSGGGGGTTIHAPITVNVEGGSQGQQQDNALAQRIGAEVDAAMRRVVGEELRQQMRPGNLFNPVSHTI